MKAAVLRKYAKAGTNLAIEDMAIPPYGERDVLVRVLCAGVNPLDNLIMRGTMKLVVGYEPPIVMGNEFVGIIDEVGVQVEGFKKGDRVYARVPFDQIGTFAEYITVSADAIALVPDYLSDEEAACVPLTALTALQAYELMDVQPSGKLFISGGTGSVGAMAIPIAKACGLQVATSGNGKSADRMRALGVDTFIDYREQNFVDVLHDMDYVLDTLGDKALPDEFAILKPGGVLLSLRGMPNGSFARREGYGLGKRILFGIAGHKYDKMAAKRGQTYNFMNVHADGLGLAQLSNILEEGQVKPSVDSIFSLNEVNAALQKVEHGGSSGKTVLKIA